MPYTRAHMPLGGLVDTAQAAAAIVSDPCLPQVTNLVLRLHTAASGGAPGGLPSKGIGLCSAVRPLTAVVWLKEKPWRIPVVIGGGVALLVLAGFAVGRAGR